MRFKFILLALIFFAVSPFTVSAAVKADGWIFGLTVDDSWYERVSLKEVVSSLEKLKVKPTVRIVMSKDTNPKGYIKIFKEIHKVAYIMAEPVDSYEMKLYKDVKSYRKRFKESYKYLGKYVDIWEIGNEVNGEEWIKQDNKLVVDKIMAAYKEIKTKGKKTAVTFYYENPAYNRDMFKWIKKYIPKKLRGNLDYSFISYYEDDNEGYEPDWENVFKNFGALFPNSKTGMGECGNISKEATENSKIKMFNKYYSMPKHTKNYVGGYFWWNYVLDCIPTENNKVYRAVCEGGIADMKISPEDIADFYYTISNINYNAFYQRYRFYVKDGKYMSFMKQGKDPVITALRQKRILRRAEPLNYPGKNGRMLLGCWKAER